MNILFLLPRYPEEENSSTLEKEIVEAFFEKGHNVYVATILEKKFNRETEYKNEFGINILRIRTGNFRDNVKKVEKGINQLLIPFKFIKEIKSHLFNNSIDLVVTTTPITNSAYLHKKVKKIFNCKILTILWDIFPDNAVSLNMIKNKYLIKFLEKKFEKSLETADFISTMSKGNKNYVINKFPKEKEKIFILKNWAKLKPNLNIEKNSIRKKYQLSDKDFLAIFGGNIGWLQEPQNLIYLAEKLKTYKNIKILFVGNGTEKNKCKNLVKKLQLENVLFLEYIPREEYEKLIGSCDIGIVSLHKKFKVPNFPSRTTDYFKLQLPVLASLDNCAAKDYGIFLQDEVKGGLYAEAGNLEELYNQMMKLYKSKELRQELGKNGRQYYENELGVEKAYETIMRQIKK